LEAENGLDLGAGEPWDTENIFLGKIKARGCWNVYSYIHSDYPNIYYLKLLYLRKTTIFKIRKSMVERSTLIKGKLAGIIHKEAVTSEFNFN
jgi:hypothetical protein